MTLQDRSNYFKGLLLLIRKDRIVTEPEIALILRIGKVLGFEKEFCTNAINDILENTYIVDRSPTFSSPEVARRFIRDGITISFVDHDVIHPSEQEWLLSTARKNGLDDRWLRKELSRPHQHTVTLEGTLEVERLMKVAVEDPGIHRA